MDDQKKVLEMIEKGQITAAEGMELLNALNKSAEEQNDNSVTAYTSVKKTYKFLKIRVTSDNNSVNVNVNIPIRLLGVFGGLAGKMTKMVPRDAREEMESKGIDITSIDFEKIIEELMNGTLDDPTIVDIEAWDEEHSTTVKVKIYAE
ncbi:MAG TPA: hypothetical protein PLL21_01055 [Sedimentibacter sp.]|jgi:hypothetical protein|nr:hypothetical protein [Sedimentibacter sp.]HNZ82748.1 hypothetical protein [Sedimentibacter sp.]HQB62943.1 hypothetical protein [Sedimentibacter sp.]